MNLQLLHQQVKKAVESVEHNNKNPEDIEVVIPVFQMGRVGPTPNVEVSSISLGFDWNTNKLFVNPVAKLREIDIDEIKSLSKEYNQLATQLMKVKDLERKVQRLTQELNKYKGDSN